MSLDLADRAGRGKGPEARPFGGCARASPGGSGGHADRQDPSLSPDEPTLPDGRYDTLGEIRRRQEVERQRAFEAFHDFP